MLAKEGKVCEKQLRQNHAFSAEISVLHLAIVISKSEYDIKFRYLKIKILDVELSRCVSTSMKRLFLRRLWRQENDSFVKMIHATTLNVNWFCLTSMARNSPHV